MDRISWIIVGVFLVLVGFVIGYTTYNIHQDTAAYNARGITTEAIVVDKNTKLRHGRAKRGKGGGIRYQVHYRYDHQQFGNIKNIKTVKKKLYKKIQVGDAIEIIYLPDKKEAQQDIGGRSYETNTNLYIGSFIMLLGLGLIFLKR